MNRIICFDLETTGFEFENGEKIIEIGAIEIIDNKITSNSFHEYINPDGKKIDIESFKVHKLSNEFLSDKPSFKEIAPKFLEYIQDSPLVAHNGIKFDFPFINYQLKEIGLPEINMSRQIDTYLMALKRINEIKRFNLDALADWFGIDRTKRENAHGALIDTEILAEIYLHLIEKPEFKSYETKIKESLEKMHTLKKQNRPYREFSITNEDIENHKKYIDSLVEKKFMKNPSWFN